MSDSEVPSTNPWDATYRDESARLLVRGMLQHQGALLAQHPWVPVQGYAVQDENGTDSGALTVGALVTLWERAPDLMYGKCMMCTDGYVRGFTISGGDTMWILAPCQLCGFVSQRSVPAPELFERLVDALDGTPYQMPNRVQLNSTSGLPHTALIAALRSLGVRLLPPEHYGSLSPTGNEMGLPINATFD